MPEIESDGIPFCDAFERGTRVLEALAKAIYYVLLLLLHGGQNKFGKKA